MSGHLSIIIHIHNDPGTFGLPARHSGSLLCLMAGALLLTCRVRVARYPCIFEFQINDEILFSIYICATQYQYPYSNDYSLLI